MVTQTNQTCVYRLRNFGNDIDCQDMESLVTALQKYRGKSITIEDKRPGGRSYFVDVLHDGIVRESYGAKKPFDPTQILR